MKRVIIKMSGEALKGKTEFELTLKLLANTPKKLKKFMI